MSDKHPKRPKDNANAIEGWERVGGASAPDATSTNKKRPRDLNQWAKHVVEVATVAAEDLRDEQRRDKAGKQKSKPD
jgi:hypothetical protein